MSKWEDSWKLFQARLPRDEKLEADLLQQVSERYPELILEVMEQIGRKHNVQIPLGHAIGGRLSGCYVNYNSKRAKFTYIQYPIRGKRGGGPYAKRIELDENSNAETALS